MSFDFELILAPSDVLPVRQLHLNRTTQSFPIYSGYWSAIGNCRHTTGPSGAAAKTATDLKTSRKRHHDRIMDDSGDRRSNSSRIGTDFHSMTGQAALELDRSERQAARPDMRGQLLGTEMKRTEKKYEIQESRTYTRYSYTRE